MRIKNSQLITIHFPVFLRRKTTGIPPQTHYRGLIVYGSRLLIQLS